MALGPTDIQVILQAATGSAERIHQLQQQYSRQQQEQLATYMHKNLEERKRQTQPLPQVGEMEIKPVSREGKEPNQQEAYNYRKKKDKFKKKVGANVDLLI